MRIRFLIFYILLSSFVFAQENQNYRQVYLEAENEYNIGHFETCIKLLNEKASLFTGPLKTSSYRLLALCYLGEDKQEEAEHSVSLLLKADPYYSVSIHDPVRFIDIVEKIKKGEEGTLVTASMQAETQSEAPVPVTLITEEMITAIGATSLKDALVAYVPGITSIESNGEDNIAMRGIYASGQQKILIMLNGQRLNSHSTNVATPDFSMSLEKVKQIEVLRGPASSLYGSIALTAVVNLITKDGGDIDGVSLKAGFGNNKQLKADFLYGKTYLDLDLFAWASIYKSDGQSVFMPASKQYALLPQDGDILIGGYNRNPSYDIGCTLGLGNWNLLFSRSHSKKATPLGATIFCCPYGYDSYNDYNGEGPGHAVASTNARLSYQRQLKDYHLSLQVNFNQNDATNYDAAGDTPENVFYIPVANSSEYYSPTQKVFQYLHWEDYSLGINLKAETNYQFGAKQHGSIIGGVEYESFCLHDSYFLGGENNKVLAHSYIDNGEETVPNLVQKGREQVANAFIQLKHYFTSRLLFNGGLRFDYKSRNDGQKIKTFSPRLSLVHLGDNLNFKLSYSRAFVDAPYFMRNTILRTYKGGSDLRPEYLNSFQFATQLNHLLTNIDLELNLFYNEANDVTVMTRSETLGQHYSNAASMSMAGTEFIFKYQAKRWLINMNTTFQQVISGNNFMSMSENGYIRNVPKFVNNLTMSYKLWDTERDGCFSIHTYLSYTSKQKTLLSVMPSLVQKEIHQEIPDCFLMNMGVHYQWKHIALSGDIKNLFDKYHLQGGSSVVPIQQLGRQVLFQVKYAF